MLAPLCTNKDADEEAEESYPLKSSNEQFESSQ